MNNDALLRSGMGVKGMIVLGTVNRDQVVTVDRHPAPGETVMGHSYQVGTGGKGSNQAVAAAVAGGRPTLISAVGDDASGTEMLEDLVGKGVDVSHVIRVPGTPSGVAQITVSADGENSIVVAPGAATSLEPDATTSVVEGLVGPGSVVLAQLELPLAVVEQACLAAHNRGARVVLNLSPSIEIAGSLLSACDPLIVNQSEAAALLGASCDTIEAAILGAQALAVRCRSVVITLGGEGVVVADGGSARHFPARSVPVIDTTGAGDSFAGALAAALFRGRTLDESVQLGIDASSLTVQHVGAQPSAPTRPRPTPPQR